MSSASPFPGMDPYLETYWSDVHTRLITYAANQLGSQLPSGLKARLQEYVAVEYEELSRELRIIDTKSGGKLVTTIEILSPSDKTSSGIERFRRKQNDLLRTQSNLVEIDLFRDGGHALSVPEGHLPPEYRRPYRICVIDGLNPQEALVYHAPLRERLPTIPIPLRYFDRDEVRLDLQSLIDQAYVDGAYGDLDYSVDAIPPLEGEDAA